MKKVPLNLKLNKTSSKYVSDKTLVYNIPNCYRVSKYQIVKQLHSIYPELKVSKVLVLRYGISHKGKKVGPKTKVVVYTDNKNVTQ